MFAHLRQIWYSLTVLPKVWKSEVSTVAACPRTAAAHGSCQQTTSSQHHQSVLDDLVRCTLLSMSALLLLVQRDLPCSIWVDLDPSSTPLPLHLQMLMRATFQTLLLAGCCCHCQVVGKLNHVEQ